MSEILGYFYEGEMHALRPVLKEWRTRVPTWQRDAGSLQPLRAGRGSQKACRSLIS